MSRRRSRRRSSLVPTDRALTRSLTSTSPPQPWGPPTGTVIAQTAYGRITALDEGGYSVELGEAPIPPERSEAGHAAAMQMIRAFLETPDLGPTYTGLQRHTENAGILAEVYDSAETRFMADVAAGWLMYMKASSAPPSRAGTPALSPRDLHDRMTEYVSSKNPCFDGIEDQLVFEACDGHDADLFRWNSPAPDGDRRWNRPTFVQIGVDNYGIVFGSVVNAIAYRSTRARR